FWLYGELLQSGKCSLSGTLVLRDDNQGWRLPTGIGYSPSLLMTRACEICQYGVAGRPPGISMALSMPYKPDHALHRGYNNGIDRAIVYHSLCSVSVAHLVYPLLR